MFVNVTFSFRMEDHGGRDSGYENSFQGCYFNCSFEPRISCKKDEQDRDFDGISADMKKESLSCSVSRVRTRTSVQMDDNDDMREPLCFPNTVIFGDNTVFVECSFRNITFNGGDLYGYIFGCTLERVKVYGVRCFDFRLFDHCILKDVEMSDVTSQISTQCILGIARLTHASGMFMEVKEILPRSVQSER